MRQYATVDDLTAGEWLAVMSDDAKTLIRHGSLLVEQATRMDVYNVDEDGYPTEPKVRDAFRDAVCQQVATWVAAGVNPSKGITGQTPQVTSQSAGGGSVSYGGTLSVAELGAAATQLGPMAYVILRNAGLGNGREVGYL